jgi:CheY-like chemotaxis protein/anti-sigma regulatory factor (Ser/Thr protein kinase)
MATILVVDDLAMQRQLVNGLLSRLPGNQLVFASNGKEALSKLAAYPADLVLTDLLMPEMDGLELLRAVRRDHPQLPVILMTAGGSEQIAVQALQEGAASYVPKRAMGRRLAETVNSVLAASQAERTHSELGKRLTSQEFTFALENDATLVLALPSFLKPYLITAGLTDNLALTRTHMVLEEALVNALYHGNLELGDALKEKGPDELAELATRRATESPYKERRIHIRASLTPERAEFTIHDDGPGFNIATLPDATDVASLDRPRGRGVLLMRTFMDEVRYNEAGNAVTMTKRLKPVSAPPAAEEPKNSLEHIPGIL